jgi:hypothetical protein
MVKVTKRPLHLKPQRKRVTRMLKITGLIIIILLHAIPFLLVGCPNRLEVTCLNDTGTVLLDNLIFRVICIIYAAYVMHFMHLTYCSRLAKNLSKIAFGISVLLLVTFAFSAITEPREQGLFNEVVL